MPKSTTAGQLIDLHDIGTDQEPKLKLLIKTEPSETIPVAMTIEKQAGSSAATLLWSRRFTVIRSRE